MGWVQYIIVPKLKAKFEISRNFDYNPGDITELNQKLMQLQDVVNSVFENELFHKELHLLNINDITQMLKIVESASEIEYDDIKILLYLAFLNERGIDWSIISESAIEEMKKYEDYTTYSKIIF